MAVGTGFTRFSTADDDYPPARWFIRLHSARTDEPVIFGLFPVIVLIFFRPVDIIIYNKNQSPTLQQCDTVITSRRTRTHRDDNTSPFERATGVPEEESEHRSNF